MSLQDATTSLVARTGSASRTIGVTESEVADSGGGGVGTVETTEVSVLCYNLPTRFYYTCVRMFRWSWLQTMVTRKNGFTFISLGPENHLR